jgi:hypothetical protein
MPQISQTLVVAIRADARDVRSLAVVDRSPRHEAAGG